MRREPDSERSIAPPGHVCSPPYPLKAAASCLCCQEPVFEVRQTDTREGSPFYGHPIRVGPALEAQTQVELLLNDGTEVDITFCVDCAPNVRPEHYSAVWEACVHAQDVYMRHRGNATDAYRIGAVATLMSKWPLAFLRRRRAAPLGGGVSDVTVDRR